MNPKRRLILIVVLSWGSLFPALAIPYAGLAISLAWIGYCWWAAQGHPVEGLPASRVRFQFLLLLPPTILIALMRSLDRAGVLSEMMFEVLGVAAIATAAAWMYAAAYLHQRLSRC